MKNTSSFPLIIGASILIAVGGGFLAGTKYQQGKTINNFPQFAGSFGSANGGGRMMGGQVQRDRIDSSGARGMGFRPVSGQIIGSDANSITVKMTDGSSKIVFINDNTNISEATKVDKTVLNTGVSVAVFGQTNNDGSVTAQSIQLNPEYRAQDNRMVPEEQPQAEQIAPSLSQ